MTIAAPDTKMHTVEYLRGAAALMVAWYHFTGSYVWGPVRASGMYGWLGVEVFFVISGFVLPLSLWARYRTDYTASAFREFAWRRIVRIEPPYLLSVVMAATLWWASSLAPGFRGEAPDVTVGQLLAHIAYLPTVSGYEWLQPVYWTLAYEFCFYLVIGATYPLLVRSPLTTLFLTTTAATLLWFVIFGGYNPRLVLFPLGAVVFLRLAGLIDRRSMLAVVGLLFALIALGNWKIGLAGFLTAMTIDLFVTKRAWPSVHSVLIFLGSISYSLYITHVPIGGRIVNLGVRVIDHELDRLLVSLLALVVSLTVAWVFHRLVERPFIELSKQVSGRAFQQRLRAIGSNTESGS